MAKSKHTQELRALGFYKVKMNVRNEFRSMVRAKFNLKAPFPESPLNFTSGKDFFFPNWEYVEYTFATYETGQAWGSFGLIDLTHLGFVNDSPYDKT